MRFLLIGDIHFRTNTPRSRNDDIVVAIKSKFAYIEQLISKEKADAVLCTGDIFDISKTTNESLLLAKEMFESLKIPVYSIIGNHDMIGNSIENHERSSLNILKMICSNFYILDNSTNLIVDDVCITARHYGDHSYKVIPTNCDYNILISHTMVVDSPTMFESIHVSDVLKETDADFVLVGHNHKKFIDAGPNSLHNKSCVYNPGALIRLSIAEGDYDRDIEVGLIDTETKVFNMFNIPTNKNCFNLEEIEEREAILADAFVDSLNMSIEYIQPVENIVHRIMDEANVRESVRENMLKRLKNT